MSSLSADESSPWNLLLINVRFMYRRWMKCSRHLEDWNHLFPLRLDRLRALLWGTSTLSVSVVPDCVSMCCDSVFSVLTANRPSLFYSLAKLPINPVSLIQFIKVGAVVPARANHSGPVINHWNAFVETKKWTWTDLKPVGKNRRSNDRCDRSKVWKRWLLLMNLWSLEVKSLLMRDEQKICAARWTHWGGGAWFVSIL